MLVFVECDVFVNLVGEDEGARVSLDEGGNLLELFAGEYFSRRVLGGVEKEKAGARGKCRRKFTPV